MQSKTFFDKSLSIFNLLPVICIDRHFIVYADLQRARYKVTLKCDQDRTERIAAAIATGSIVEIEHAGISSIVVIAPTVEERPVRVRKVRVIALSLFLDYIINFYCIVVYCYNLTNNLLSLNKRYYNLK